MRAPALTRRLLFPILAGLALAAAATSAGDQPRPSAPKTPPPLPASSGVAKPDITVSVSSGGLVEITNAGPGEMPVGPDDQLRKFKVRLTCKVTNAKVRGVQCGPPFDGARTYEISLVIVPAKVKQGYMFPVTPNWVPSVIVNSTPGAVTVSFDYAKWTGSTYDIGAEVDTDNVIAEGNESNNTAHASVQLGFSAAPERR